MPAGNPSGYGPRGTRYFDVPEVHPEVATWRLHKGSAVVRPPGPQIPTGTGGAPLIGSGPGGGPTPIAGGGYGGGGDKTTAGNAPLPPPPPPLERPKRAPEPPPLTDGTVFTQTPQEERDPQLEPLPPKPKPKKKPKKLDPWDDPRYLSKLSLRLAKKAEFGTGLPASNITPAAGTLPSNFLKIVQDLYPFVSLIGWDESKFTPEEAELFRRLRVRFAEDKQMAESLRTQGGGR